MSNFKAKNLQFSAPEAPFLASLRSQGDGDAERGIPRAGVYGQGRRRMQKRDVDGEDEPLVVDEQGNQVDLGAMERADEGDGGDVKDGQSDAVEGAENVDEGVERSQEGGEVKFGAGRKRKAGKVVGAEVGDEGDEEGGSAKVGVKDEMGRDVRSVDETKVKGEQKKDGKMTKSVKSKRKKIALSFNDG